ncbi:MAG: RluA family pseudouridine synthase [Firmicutes bacterium]|nr:RluA family pseudouridine synthase [Alicyclobacillaceae bacterium]MCL6496503.1 RluA family pseudouridine synthase [Bacillota bacterium]
MPEAVTPDPPPTTVVVPAEAQGRRIDAWLAEIRPDRSRSDWQQQIRAHRVLVNGHPVRASHILKVGDVVVLPSVDCDVRPRWTLPPAPPGGEPPPDWVLYQDSYLVVLNKPVGMVVHPSPGHWEDSLVHRLWPAWREGAPPEDWRPGVVHRLDKDTSGCLLWAKTADVQRQLVLAVARREVERWYLALVAGHPDPLHGQIEGPIGRDPHNRLKMAVVEGGRPAVTVYETVARWRGYALMLVKLKTGRTHQIRVHFSSLGHPVVGDAVYGGNQALGLSHQALHAWRIAFRHPVSRELLCFTAPLPASWKVVAERLGAPDGRPTTSSQASAFPDACSTSSPWDAWMRLMA